ncbi:tripartite tricarboxylate transporter TctB family protein [Amphritea sp.]|uniref:tripartite tricarboxylate transporter TctB family protein n=1 Tax=Amphritea sp. TaxID=1872502 RepID=UPI003A8D0F14
MVKIENAVTLLMISLGIVGYIETQKITGFAFDSLGSKAIPEGVSILLILIGLLVLSSNIYQLWKGKTDETLPASSEKALEANEPVELSGFARPLAIVILVILYISAVFVLRWPVSVMTMAFVVMSATLLPMPNRKQGTIYALIAGLVVGVGIELIFTQFFFVDLPTLW